MIIIHNTPERVTPAAEAAAAMTQAQRDAETRDQLREANKATIADRADVAITANAAFLALASPSNAQVLAQTRVLTRAVTALIRIVLALLLGRADKLDTTAGTNGN